jgi:hypothetical protein
MKSLNYLVSLLLDSNNIVDVAIGKLIEPPIRKWYEWTNLGLAAQFKYRFTKMLVFLRLRSKIDIDFEFPELAWSLDF